MPAHRIQARFLLRGSGLLFGFLILWFFVLQNPMAFLLRHSARTLGAVLLGVPASKMIVESGSGDWTFEIPIEFDAASGPANSPSKHYRSIDFDMPRSGVNAFTFSLPVYWAIILAAPWTSRTVRVFLQGTLFLSLLEIVLLLVFAELFAHKTAARMAHSMSGFADWVFRLGEYLVINVVPYIAPFVIALWLHRELRDHVLGWISRDPPAGRAAAAPQTPALDVKRRAARARAS